ncbi:phosphatidylinositol-specific phospholipase C1-like protein [Spirosoma spitsbergense]|uniref:phosphatidylinositol-specific phospholipase C1-like protein n=1 Tax=Spirosoma spitsbergense TaxID=431554 RepID=UPI0003A0AF7D|nr:phosphatidylinositol-specific phospholipase C1-like protein [Spirosoma spitsbergense]
MKTLFSLLFLGISTLTTPPDFNTKRINQIQVIGSHNSYKQAIDPALFSMLSRTDSVRFKGIEYSHTSLSEQLDLGLRGLEIDVYADEKGGKYAQPLGMKLAKGQPPYDPGGEMNTPGFKVLHIQDIDFRSNCPTFAGCLAELKRWSDAHPDHYPVYVTMNAKDDTIKRPGFVIPESFTAAVLNRLDSAVVQGLGRNKLLTPDDVRGKSKTLEAAVLAGNWPMAKNARGKFLFVLDETGTKRAAYINGHPSLKGRTLFTNSEPGTPEAAFLIMNDPRKDEVRITELVKKGYLVRTRADADTREARQNDYRSFEAAQRSGAQIITTDYYRPSTHFKSDYIIHFSDKGYVRVDPVQQ